MLPGGGSGRSISSWVGQLLACMGGCLGCCSKPTPIIAVDEPSKGLKIQGRTVKKPSFSEDFWSTSTYEMDNSGIQSQRSISSMSTSTQAHDFHGAVSTSNTSEFVNHGLLLWNQTRRQWVANKRPENRAQHVREPGLSWNATYDSLLGTNKPFPQPIPLSEMVDFLVDIWEQEGMYD
uniref:Germin-like protein subfamily 1 member 15 n=1 Tax=Anthurium amnicola TaxID=1678845 RepID=A0A1D1XII7_9ARAE